MEERLTSFLFVNDADSP